MTKTVVIARKPDDQSDPLVLIKAAHQHWDRIGWPEDKQAIAWLERAIALLTKKN